MDKTVLKRPPLRVSIRGDKPAASTARAWPADEFEPRGSAADRILDQAVYLHSGRLDPETLICDDAGPGYGSTMALPTGDVGQLEHHADAGRMVILCNRLTADEWRHVIDVKRRRPELPIVAKIVDPYYPKRSVFGFLAELAGMEHTAFLSVYEPREAVRDFLEELDPAGRRWLVLPYPYLPNREVEHSWASRRNQVILTGAMSADVYPLRTALRDRRRTSIALRRKVALLPHPGYPDIGQRRKHGIVGRAFVEELARFRHMFLCPTRAGVELLKYIECAYAGCVPVGIPPASFDRSLTELFVITDPERMDASVAEAVDLSVGEAEARAAAYRRAIRAARSRTEIRERLAEFLVSTFPR